MRMEDTFLKWVRQSDKKEEKEEKEARKGRKEGKQITDLVV